MCMMRLQRHMGAVARMGPASEDEALGLGWPVVVLPPLAAVSFWSLLPPT